MSKMSSRQARRMAARRINRRSFLKLGGVATLGMAGLSLVGCGGGSSTSGGSDSGDVTIGMLNYEDWMGEDEVSDFQAESGVTVKQYPTPDGGDSAWVNAVSKDDGVYDLALAGIIVSTRLKNNDLLADFDADKVPNLKYVGDTYIEQYPYGIPVEQGKVGFIYNTDLIDTPPATWEELLKNSGDYEGGIILPGFDGDVIDSALLALGLDINTSSTDDITAAKDLLISIKSNIKSFLDSGAADTVADGSAAIAVGYDYEFASTAPDAPNLAWYIPDEGTFGYLDGWVPLAKSKHLDEVYDFMNFHLDPDNYADFIDTTAASWIEEDIKDDLDEEIADCDSLQPYEGKVTYQQFVAGEITEAKTEAFQEIQNA